MQARKKYILLAFCASWLLVFYFGGAQIRLLNYVSRRKSEECITLCGLYSDHDASTQRVENALLTGWFAFQGWAGSDTVLLKKLVTGEGWRCFHPSSRGALQFYSQACLISLERDSA
ncbi:hypothetical protein EOD39_14231 [Acipenser ruthenus]|uniref:Uncharacterized protein n=1 Tax=Acipenser ruthenus TaxID=7906 RepID=A0A662YMD4_ACIRT|nr:hypothetical protein EOD39_14231 [Acipenser ruthenus]